MSGFAGRVLYTLSIPHFRILLRYWKAVAPPLVNFQFLILGYKVNYADIVHAVRNFQFLILGYTGQTALDTLITPQLSIPHFRIRIRS